MSLFCIFVYAYNISILLIKKLKARSSVLEKTSQLTQEHKAKYKKVMTMDYMSSEYSVTDDDGSDMFVASKLEWRSEELNKLFGALDQKHVSRMSRSSRRMLVKRSEANECSRRQPPRKSYSFAVKEPFRHAKE